ncbi:hypoxanthine phosphoribosyltransferase [Legionella steigerwaltii]|uniref:Hypoxanthine phosphoribosyltransferase n=1 Tax=Legionella steigerwaltii TaxID=460 RepID=A0A378L8W7_9GAMM|nr:phosphoribosyltransferase family protein [Legionella steigerwaltii]KTD80789.1 hypoxanthine-guanine phosphoribosyltransferase [Legionella steigerwaltii]STY23525.1 hypoxanthine phosphoribosyltransferase [Legionella steigerwaltii]
MGKEAILKQLQEIQELKNKVAKRVWSKALLIREIDEDKFDKKGDALTERVIKERIKFLAERIIKAYPDADPVLISLMDGALPFASLLQNALNERGYKYSYTTMQASSYEHKMTSGELKIGSMPKIPLGGRTVFVLDDVCDTGKTYLKIRDLLESLGAKKVSLIVLVDKVQKRINGYMPEYVGFEVPAYAFIVGMGLDYYGELRNEPEIRGVDLSSLPTPEEQELLDSEASLNEELIKLIALEKTTKPGSSMMTVFGGSADKLRKSALDIAPEHLPTDSTQAHQNMTSQFY